MRIVRNLTEEVHRRLEAELSARRAYEADQAVLRELRMAMRDCLVRLICDRRWKVFAMPPDPELDPDYYEQVMQIKTCST